MSKDLYDAKDCLAANDAEGALRCLDEAARISDEALTDKRARRAILRVTVCHTCCQRAASVLLRKLWFTRCQGC